MFLCFCASRAVSEKSRVGSLSARSPLECHLPGPLPPPVLLSSRSAARSITRRLFPASISRLTSPSSEASWPLRSIAVVDCPDLRASCDRASVQNPWRSRCWLPICAQLSCKLSSSAFGRFLLAVGFEPLLCAGKLAAVQLVHNDRHMGVHVALAAIPARRMNVEGPPQRSGFSRGHAELWQRALLPAHPRL